MSPILVGTHLAVLLVGVAIGYGIAHLELHPREAVVKTQRIKKWAATTTLPMFMGSAALIAMAVYVPINQSQQHDAAQRPIDCLTQYANRLHDSLAPRQQAAKKLQTADLAWKRAVAALLVPGNDKADIARVRSTLAHDTDVADALSHKRAAHPYPSPPREACPQ